jgi:hypothetical protein
MAIGKVIIVIDIIRDTGTRIDDLASRAPRSQATCDGILRSIAMIRVSKVGVGGEVDDGLLPVGLECRQIVVISQVSLFHLRYRRELWHFLSRVWPRM